LDWSGFLGVWLVFDRGGWFDIVVIAELDFELLK